MERALKWGVAAGLACLTTPAFADALGNIGGIVEFYGGASAAAACLVAGLALFLGWTAIGYRRSRQARERAGSDL